MLSNWEMNRRLTYLFVIQKNACDLHNSINDEIRKISSIQNQLRDLRSNCEKSYLQYMEQLDERFISVQQEYPYPSSSDHELILSYLQAKSSLYSDFEIKYKIYTSQIAYGEKWISFLSDQQKLILDSLRESNTNKIQTIIYRVKQSLYAQSAVENELYLEDDLEFFNHSTEIQSNHPNTFFMQTNPFLKKPVVYTAEDEKFISMLFN
ncbi:MAG: hypothetical protein SFW66_07055 [Gammaproteobacteria bacterium]|nr:hypothetical protein [Gammaproteobacteria bacterium]